MKRGQGEMRERERRVVNMCMYIVMNAVNRNSKSLLSRNTGNTFRNSESSMSRNFSLDTHVYKDVH